ncbi:hypothetical protein QEZ48_15520 [Aquamicrobium lusatiense]|uniref:hypothetical protein n=1 Tax=Aquamicrobium lusatiense TaxID=89772 RepID=UPI002455A373|nr:hypothetical protein [Aquamicrobium lusatiense]MDH4992226.1 hypothetical protein [Aquamicrobium lusatiense]
MAVCNDRGWSMTAAERIREALETALIHIEEVMGQEPPVTPSLSVVDDPEFWAVAEMSDDGLHLRISTGTADRIHTLWTAALRETSVLGDDGPITDDVAFLTRVSLIWLILHEITHGELRHFAFMGDIGISETDAPRSLGLVSRVSESTAAPIASFDGIERLQAEHCLELQADHEAGEYILEAWSPNEWDSLRVRSACIMAVMILIEQAEAVNAVVAPTHPKAATRRFQLMGHLATLWMIPAQINAQAEGLSEPLSEDLPPDEVVQAYRAQVVLPVLADAAKLASVFNDDSVFLDLSELDNLFADITTAQLGLYVSENEFRTAGGKEWSRLATFSPKVMGMLDLEGLSL